MAKKEEGPREVPKHCRICARCDLPFSVQTEPHCRCNMWEVGKKKD